MTPVDPVLYESFARESAGVLRADLRGWALQALLSGLPYEARVAERDRALRLASDFLAEGTCMSERVRQLHAALVAARRSTRPAHPDFGSMAGCLALALLARDNIPNERQLRRILTKGCQKPA